MCRGRYLEDVIEELAPQFGEAIPKSASVESNGGTAGADSLTHNASDRESTEVQTILYYLKNADKLHVDSIIEGSGLSAPTVLKLLLDLELRGLVTQHPGKLFSLV